MNFSPESYPASRKFQKEIERRKGKGNRVEMKIDTDWKGKEREGKGKSYLDTTPKTPTAKNSSRSIPLSSFGPFGVFLQCCLSK